MHENESSHFSNTINQLIISPYLILILKKKFENGQPNKGNQDDNKTKG